MKQELVEKIQNDFPWFPKRDPLYHSDFPMSIDCDDGWFSLIYKLCQDIDVVVKREDWKDFCVDQVKEKFAGLRFYIGGANKEVFDLIDKAEAKSYKTCERCGKRGSMYISEWSWYKTLCKKCAETDDKHTWIKPKKEQEIGNFVVSLRPIPA